MIRAHCYGSYMQREFGLPENQITYRDSYCTGTHHLLHTRAFAENKLNSSTFVITGPCDGSCGGLEISPELEAELHSAVATA